MSGIEWLGERWTGRETRSALSVHVCGPDEPCARAQWNLQVYHLVRPADGNPTKADRWIQIEISNLYFDTTDWRRFENAEIRADSAWHTAHEETNERGELVPCRITVSCFIEDPKGGAPAHAQWIGHDFLVRFGRRDGFYFPCEIDGWLLPEETYYRTEPETPAEAARFPEEPPNLRVLANVEFEGGSIWVPRCADPALLAKRYAREAIGCDDFLEPHVSWASRMTSEGKSEPVPGWSSTVYFRTTKLPPE